jgi:hypothetical protein
MSRIKNLPALAAAALLTIAGAAQADTVNLRYAGADHTTTTSVYINGATLNNVLIGSYRLEQQGQPGSFIAYCVDPFQQSSGSYSAYDRSPLVAAQLPSVEAVRFANVSKLFGNAYAGSLANNTKAAGFQLALWEVWHDDGNLATGIVRSVGGSNAAMVAEANSLLGSMAGWSTGTSYELTRYSSASYQDFVTAAVPEPETYALLLAGLGMLGFARRRVSSPA